jgi:hypothetical protein
MKRGTEQFKKINSLFCFFSKKKRFWHANSQLLYCDNTSMNNHTYMAKIILAIRIKVVKLFIPRKQNSHKACGGSIIIVVIHVYTWNT